MATEWRKHIIIIIIKTMKISDKPNFTFETLGMYMNMTNNLSTVCNRDHYIAVENHNTIKNNTISPEPQ